MVKIKQVVKVEVKLITQHHIFSSMYTGAVLYNSGTYSA